jgi:hypothetical protein
MNDLERLVLRATLHKCKKQIARPMGVSHSEEKAAMDRGLLRFEEWPTGHYNITAAGHAFLSEATEP